MKLLKGLFEKFKKDLEEKRKLNEEINEEVKKIRLEGMKERIIEVEKARQQYKKEDAIDALDSSGTGGGGFGRMFEKFQDYCTDFAKKQDKNNRRY